MESMFVFRRYSEFLDLHQALDRLFPEAPFPPFPPKIYIRRSSVKSVAISRMQDLDYYIKVWWMRLLFFHNISRNCGTMFRLFSTFFVITQLLFYFLQGLASMADVVHSEPFLEFLKPTEDDLQNFWFNKRLSQFSNNFASKYHWSVIFIYFSFFILCFRLFSQKNEWINERKKEKKNE